MAKIVLELQQAALDGSADITRLLRMTFMVASKLGLADLKSWVSKELNGYSDTEEVPGYRHVRGDIKVFHPVRKIWIPLMWQGGDPTESRSVLMRGSIPQLGLQLAQVRKGGGTLTESLPDSAKLDLMRVAKTTFPPEVVLQIPDVANIVNSVQNMILEWSLKLEEDGILGEGLSFSIEEKKIAMGQANTYNITNFHGVLGNVSESKVQVGNHNAIFEELAKLGIPKEEIAVLKELDEEAQSVSSQQNASIAERGLNWVLRNSERLGGLSDSIRGWFQA